MDGQSETRYKAQFAGRQQHTDVQIYTKKGKQCRQANKNNKKLENRQIAQTDSWLDEHMCKAGTKADSHDSKHTQKYQP